MVVLETVKPSFISKFFFILLFRSTSSRPSRFCNQCKKYVKDLPRHMRSKKHNWSNESCKSSVGLLGQRKSYEWKVPKQGQKKDYHYCRMCPIPNCKTVTKRMDVHLTNSKAHQLPKNDLYFQLLKSAKKYIPPNAEEVMVTSPQKIKLNTCPPPSVLLSVEDTREKELEMQFISEPIIECEEISPLDISNNEINDNNIPDNKMYGVRFNRKRKLNENANIITYPENIECSDLITLMKKRHITVRCPRNLELILDSFFPFLIGPDGGKKDEANAKQIASEVRRVFLSMRLTSLVELFQKNRIRDEYLMGYCLEKKHAAESVKKYLKSLEDFLSFLIIDEIDITGVSTDKILQTKLKIIIWKKEYKKDAEKVSWLKEIQQYEMLVDPTQVRQYQNSDSAVKARRLYKHFGDGNECDLNQHEYVAMRDHLFVCIHFSNAHRSGVSAHLTLKEFSRKEVRDGKINLMVHDHKTKRQGPATISLTHDEFEMLQIYVTKVRPQIRTSSDNVFITFNGLSMKSGAISRQIDSLWVKAGIYEKSQNRKKLNCNIIRKSTTTGTRENNLGMEQEVADLMAHSKKQLTRITSFDKK